MNQSQRSETGRGERSRGEPGRGDAGRGDAGRVDAIDATIGQIEVLYRSLTGRDAPPPGEGLSAVVPPEKAPEQLLEEQLGVLLQGLSQLDASLAVPSWTPRIAVWERRDELVVLVDVPGVPRDGLDVRLAAPRLLEVSGQRETSAPDEDDGPRFALRHAEQARGRFRRLVPLPFEAAAQDVDARLADGQLELRLRRADPQQQDVHTIHVD